MKRTLKVSEQDLIRIVRKIIKESEEKVVKGKIAQAVCDKPEIKMKNYQVVVVLGEPKTNGNKIKENLKLTPKQQIEMKPTDKIFMKNISDKIKPHEVELVVNKNGKFEIEY